MQRWDALQRNVSDERVLHRGREHEHRHAVPQARAQATARAMAEHHTTITQAEMEMKQEYVLLDTKSGRRLSVHPNVNGAMLSALFHVKTGDQVVWRMENEQPIQVAAKVNGKQRFRVFDIA